MLIDNNGNESHHGLVCGIYAVDKVYWAALMEPREDGSMGFSLVKTTKYSQMDATPELHLEYRKWASDRKRYLYSERKQLSGFIAGSEYGTLGVGARVTVLPPKRAKAKVNVPGGAVGTVFWEGEDKFKIGEMRYGVEYTEYTYDDAGNMNQVRGSGFLPRERLIVIQDYPPAEVEAAQVKLAAVVEALEVVKKEFE
jgi:hypothetical protein